MESVHQLTLPTSVSMKTEELSCIKYLNEVELLIIGTDLGSIYFYECFKRCFVHNKFTEMKVHYNRITDIISSQTKKGVEVIYISSTDGIISIWEVEIGETKHKTQAQPKSNLQFVDKHLAVGVKLEKKLINKLSPKDLKELFLYHAEVLFPNNSIPPELLKKRGNSMHENGNAHSGSVTQKGQQKDIKKMNRVDTMVIPKLVNIVNLHEQYKKVYFVIYSVGYSIKHQVF